MSRRDDMSRSYRDTSGREYRRDYIDRERVFRESTERTRLREGDIEPRPNGVYCNPLCPYFRCGKKALSYRTIGVGQGSKVVAFCSWVGDQCIAGSCQFAFCEKRYLLPGNKCLYAIEKEKRKTSADIFRELEEEEREARRVRDHLKRHYGKDLDLY